MTSPPPSGDDASSLERRIAQLEYSLGLVVSSPTSDAKTNPELRDVHSRIDLLLSGVGGRSGGDHRKVTPLSSEALSRDLEACDHLARDLDPGYILTHQLSTAASLSSASVAASAAPLLYRRQEVLASRDRLGEDLKMLGYVRDLLMIAPSSRGEKGATTGGKDGKKLSPATAVSGDIDGGRFLDAPLLSSSSAYVYACNPDALQRLGSVSSRVVDLHVRTEDAASRVDDLLGRYRGVMAAVSEKLVMADEDLSTKGY